MLHNELKKLNKLPFHMPGHKRNKEFGIAGSEIDITEIEDFDNLHCPSGLIAELENRLSDIYGAERSMLLVNGSTSGILVAIHSVCKRGDTIIIARNCHKSVFNACFLLELRIIFVEPEYDEIHGIYKSIRQNTVDEAIKANPNAAAVVITSPTYEGYISSIKTGLPLIIDAAHGAHLGLGGFPDYPKGDIVVSSLHKTLPALTQTAVINVYNKAYIERIKQFTDIFETSSPSYVLMNSASICCEYIINNSKAFEEYRASVEEIHELPLNKLNLLNTDDKGKIVVSTAKADISGVELADKLRNDYNIEPEAASISYVILMTSVADSEKALEILKSTLLEIDSKCSAKGKTNIIPQPPCPASPLVITTSENTENADLYLSEGKISAEFIFAYPPDIPIITPNEIITNEALEYIKASLKSGVNIISDSGLLPNYILTKAN